MGPGLKAAVVQVATAGTPKTVRDAALSSVGKRLGNHSKAAKLHLVKHSPSRSRRVKIAPSPIDETVLGSLIKEWIVPILVQQFLSAGASDSSIVPNNSLDGEA